LFNIFRNIKSLEINFDGELNSSELIHKIHLPNLKKLEIKRTSELCYFIGLYSLEYISIDKLDDFNYSMIDEIFTPRKVIELRIGRGRFDEADIFLSFFTNLKSLTLEFI